jgi:hypothetical protein
MAEVKKVEFKDTAPIAPIMAPQEPEPVPAAPPEIPKGAGGVHEHQFALAWRHANSGRALQVCEGCGARQFKLGPDAQWTPEPADGHPPWATEDQKKAHAKSAPARSGA